MAFDGQLLSGFPEPGPRRIRAVSFVETFAGDAVGERYVAEHLAPGTVAAVRELAGELPPARSAREPGPVAPSRLPTLIGELLSNQHHEQPGEPSRSQH
ncbi:hypothetical protein [Streptomyces sp. ICC1]|uniref:hypothetical protein n=1 Tax=Streptomyces sp. ICC1 TaxID=2099583 RepID=UPI0013A6E1C3|nr:hypothetical protein [Streptomyces sp. ICC1]